VILIKSHSDQKKSSKLALDSKFTIINKYIFKHDRSIYLTAGFYFILKRKHYLLKRIINIFAVALLLNIAAEIDNTLVILFNYFIQINSNFIIKS
jgi:hypothetical protein